MNMGAVASTQGRYEEAEGLYKRGLAINEKAQGVNHPAVAQALHNLACVSWRQGKYSDAEGLNKRALAIREQALGANHPDVAHTLNNLALVYLDARQIQRGGGAVQARAWRSGSRLLGRVTPTWA